MILALAGLAGCATDRASADCKNVCRREAQCVEEAAEDNKSADNRFDQSECVAACSALERDPDGKKLVADHVACAEKAGKDCAALMGCQ
jgi:hypothetical protein